MREISKFSEDCKRNFDAELNQPENNFAFLSLRYL
jgi:hypothetical protein